MAAAPTSPFIGKAQVSRISAVTVGKAFGKVLLPTYPPMAATRGARS
jgi:hypothetical protein